LNASITSLLLVIGPYWLKLQHANDRRLPARFSRDNDFRQRVTTEMIRPVHSDRLAAASSGRPWLRELLDRVK
jgi:hypothetical protein